MSCLEKVSAATPSNPHRLEVRIATGHHRGIRGDITFEGLCDAVEGSPCRMWCDSPECQEEAGEGHASHVLVDQGECGVISSLNADPSMIPELYNGPEVPLRPDRIQLTQDIDGVTWTYSTDALPVTPEEPHPGCAEACRHQCPECRLGLGTHLMCDPRCGHHSPPGANNGADCPSSNQQIGEHFP